MAKKRSSADPRRFLRRRPEGPTDAQDARYREIQRALIDRIDGMRRCSNEEIQQIISEETSRDGFADEVGKQNAKRLSKEVKDEIARRRRSG